MAGFQWAMLIHWRVAHHTSWSGCLWKEKKTYPSKIESYQFGFSFKNVYLQNYSRTDDSASNLETQNNTHLNSVRVERLHNLSHVSLVAYAINLLFPVLSLPSPYWYVLSPADSNGQMVKKICGYLFFGLVHLWTCVVSKPSKIQNFI